jgi:predicted nucleic acid-binding protein
MIFDTDIFVWHFRGDSGATKLLNQVEEIHISLMSYMELMQGARSKQEAQNIRLLLRQLSCGILPLTENIGYRAAIYIEDYALSHGLRAGDAIIAATAFENGLALYSSNEKHFKMIQGLDLQVFHPANKR